MKRFRFSLRSVAVVRAHRENRAREQFAAAVHAYVQCEEDLAEVRRRIAEFAASISSSRQGSFDASEQAFVMAGYRRQCEAEIPAERAVIAARAEMEKRRQDYLDAHKDVEVVSKLEQKSRMAHRAAQNREEQVEFDELAGHASSRRALFGL